MAMGNGMNHEDEFMHVCRTLALGQLASGGRAGRRESDGWPEAAAPCDGEGDAARAGKI